MADMDNAQEYPDALSNLFRPPRIAQPAQSGPPMVPPYPLIMRPPAQNGPADVTQAAPPPPPKPPAPSDMTSTPTAPTGQPTPPLPPPPDPANNQVAQGLARVKALQDQRNAVHVPTYQENKPHWYDRLLGVALGAAAGFGNPQLAASTAQGVTNRDYNAAQRGYNQTVAPIDQQIGAERQNFPGYEAQSRLEQEHWGDLYKMSELDRQNALAKINQENEDRKEAADKARQEKDDRANTVKENQQNTRQQQEDERERHNQENEKNRDKQLDIMGKRIDKMNEPKPPTPAQFNGANVKKQQALQKAHTNYQKATKDLDPKNADDAAKLQDAHDQFISDSQDAQDAFEQEVTTLGGTAEHEDVHNWKGFEPGSSSNAGANGNSTAAAQGKTSPSAAAPPASSGPSASMTETTKTAKWADATTVTGYYQRALQQTGGDKQKAKDLARQMLDRDGLAVPQAK
jgi:hypothetical protein